MDRLAYQNMTHGQGRGHDQVHEFCRESQTPSQQVMRNCHSYDAQDVTSRNYVPFGTSYNFSTFDRLTHPTGEMTSKMKINDHVNSYYLERQSKNCGEYSQFINALDRNIHEDQYRTSVNNDRWQSEHPVNDQLQRIYHPTLLNEPEQQLNILPDSDRYGMGTRNRQENVMARNKNTIHPTQLEQISTPQPKLGYAQQHDFTPMFQPCESSLNHLFQGLTDSTMDQQIHLLNQTSSGGSSYTYQQPIREQIITSAPLQPPIEFLDFQRPHSSNHLRRQLSQQPSPLQLQPLPLQVPEIQQPLSIQRKTQMISKSRINKHPKRK